MYGVARTEKFNQTQAATDAAEVAFSKRSNDQNFVYAYAATIRELVSDGSYQRIVARYLTP